MSKKEYLAYFEPAFKKAILNMGWNNYKKTSVFVFSKHKNNLRKITLQKEKIAA